MKMKYLVLGASRVGLRLLLAQSVLGAGTAWAKPKILDGSVVGRWQFNDSNDPGKDTSGYNGGNIVTKSGLGFVSSGQQVPESFDGTGYLRISSAGTSQTVKLGGGNTVSYEKNGEGNFLTGYKDTADYHTVAARFRYEGEQIDTSSLTDTYKNEKLMIGYINQTESWHMVALRYQKNAQQNASMYWMICTDPSTWGDPRPEASANQRPFVPVQVSGDTVTVGGKIGVSQKNVNYIGCLDEVVVIKRMLTKNELTRFWKTGETYIYAISTNPSFSEITGWSTSDMTNTESAKWKPGIVPNAAYILDGGKTLAQDSTATFGGDTGKKISLTLGRLAPLKNLLNEQESPIVSNTQGNFSQGAGTAITFYDLRLNDGTYAAGGTSLTTTLLDVDAPASKPFALAAAGDFALNVGEDTTGSGVLAKTGAGKLTVNKWTGTAKLRLAEGFIKTPRLDGYTGGTVIVDGDAVTFTGADTLSGTIQVQYNGTIAAAEATYPVLNAPTLTSDGQVEITAAIPEKYEGAPKLENGVVSLVVTKKVAPIPDEDKGAKPVLLWQ